MLIALSFATKSAGYGEGFMAKPMLGEKPEHSMIRQFTKLIFAVYLPWPRYRAFQFWQIGAPHGASSK